MLSMQFFFENLCTGEYMPPLNNDITITNDNKCPCNVEKTVDGWCVLDITQQPFEAMSEVHIQFNSVKS